MNRDDDETDPELAELALKLRELEGEQEEEPLFPESFIREFTDFDTWDEFKVRLAATPLSERKAFVARTTRFAAYEDMERAALERARSGASKARRGG